MSACSRCRSAGCADSRPREAIEGICEFGLGGRRVVCLRSLAWAAHAAAGEASDPVARGCCSCRVDGGVCLYASLGASARQTKHALGAAVYAARAREAATGDSGVGDQEIRWVIEHASPTVRALVQRMPSPSPGRTRLATLYYQLDAGLRR
jgi:hypothetical protein